MGKHTKTISGNKKITEPVEIDILALDKDKKNIILGECKFRKSPFDLGQLNDLYSKNIFSENAYYYLFSLSGFTEAVENEAAIKNNISLISINDMFKEF